MTYTETVSKARRSNTDNRLANLQAVTTATRPPAGRPARALTGRYKLKNPFQKKKIRAAERNDKLFIFAEQNKQITIKNSRAKRIKLARTL